MNARVHAAALLLLCIPLYFMGLGGYDLDLKGESREGITSWEMIHGGDWLLPRVNGEAFPQKPLLFPWMGAVATLALGERSAGAMRLPSALGAAAAVLAAWALGRRLLGERGGLLAGAFFATTLLVVSLGRSARVDMTLTLFVTLSMLCFLRIAGSPAPGPGILAAGWTCLALGVLSKGPLGIVLPALAGTAALAMQGRLADLRRFRPWPFALVPLVLAGAWYAQGIARGGAAFGSFSLLQENVRMFLGESEVHAHGPFYYVPRVFLVGLPWILLVPFALAGGNRREESFALPCAWFAAVFLVFSVGSAKRTDYLLPLVPAAALLGARLVLANEGSPRNARILVPAILVAAAGAAVAAGFAILAVLPPERIADLAGERAPRALALAFAERAAARPVLLWVAAISALAAGGLPLLGLLRGRAVRGFLAGAVATAGVALGAAATVLPADAEVSSLRPFAEEIRRVVPAEAPLLHHDAFRFQVAFYAGRRIPPLDGPAFAAFLADPGERRVVVTAAEWGALPPDARAKVAEAARSRRPGQAPAEEFVLLRRR